MQSSAKIVSKISTKTCKAATCSSCKDTKRKEREAKEHQVLSNNVKEAQITNVKLQNFDAEHDPQSDRKNVENCDKGLGSNIKEFS